MAIYQCISFCNDKLFEIESLNLSNQLQKNVPFCSETQRDDNIGNDNMKSEAINDDETRQMMRMMF